LWTKREQAKSFFTGADPIARAFGVFGHRGFRSNRTWEISPEDRHTSVAWVYVIPGVVSIAIIGWDSSMFTKQTRVDLSRPNVSSTKDALNGLGLLAHAQHMTIATQLVIRPEANEVAWEQGQLVVPTATTQYFVTQVLCKMVAAIAIERQILDQATSFLSKRVLTARMARRHLANIRGWIANPAIENQEVAELYQLGRTLYKLDARTKELLGALESISQRANESAIAGVSATALCFTLVSTGMFHELDPNISVGAGAVIGLVTWLWSRGNR
jgi:hypothetical protein